MSSNRPADPRSGAVPETTAGRSPAAGRRPLTLRARLLLVLVGVVTVLCAVIGVVSTVAVHRFQMEQRDDQLLTSAERVRRALRPMIEGGVPPWDPSRAGAPGDATPAPPGSQQTARNEVLRAHPLGTVVALVSDGEVSLALIEGPDEEEDLSQAVRDRLAALPVDGHPRTVDLPGLGEYRVVATPPARRPGGTSEVVIAGLPLADLLETRQRFILIEVTIGLAAVLLAAGAGSLMIQFTLRPLNRVAATAGRVAELPLARGEVSLAARVPVADADPRTEVGQVGTAVNRMLDHVGDALAARQASETRLRRFIADASHELRTPLAAIRGYIELTRRGPAGAPPEVAYAIDRVGSAAERMTTLVEDLLLLARLDAGRPLRSEEVDLSALIVEAASDAHVAGPEHRWTLDLPPYPVAVPGDRDRMHQVLANLLTNARVHTPAGSTVTIGLAVDGPQAVISVSDDGPGIPADLLGQVFERFARGDSSRSRTAGSSGLGLAIVASVVGAHGGTTSVDSAPGHTIFTVRLPLAPNGAG